MAQPHDHPAQTGLRPQDVALFLDVDGTLVEVAETPEAVVVEPGLKELLRRWLLLGGGALALVSGRSLSALDGLFGELLLPAAGLHGFERRSAVGAYYRHELPAGAVLDRARRVMARIAARCSGLLLEDKRFALALHYRQAPGFEREVIADVLSIARLASRQFEVQRGKMVIELCPKGATKAKVVAEFMEEAPFQRRTPVYFGDDLTDEDAFSWVNAHGGVSVAVNVARPTAANYRVASVTEARSWLEQWLQCAGSARR